MKSKIGLIDKTSLVDFGVKQLLCKYDGVKLLLVVLLLSSDTVDSFEGLVLYSSLNDTDLGKTLVLKKFGFEIFRDTIILKNG